MAVVDIASISPGSNVPDGLTSSEAAARLQQYGPNAVSEVRPNTFLLLLRRFWGLVPWMLELAILLDLVLGRWAEAAIIAVLLVFNVLMGFAQERRAQGALSLLRQRLTVNARVRRDGRWQTCPAAEIVPGDVVHLRVGNIVPADIQLSEGNLSVDQSQLTGESLPISHQGGSTIYAGSLVRRGEASGVVTATGIRTYYGKTAELVRTAAAPARAETLIVGIAKYLAGVDALLAAAVVAVVMIRGLSLLESLPFVLMLLVASVPHALPTMFTMSSTLGARALAENGVLVTRLTAIQDAAAMDVLCVDKTGTLTENRLAVAKIVGFAGTSEDEVLRAGALTSDEATQDPIDLAIIQAAKAKALLPSTAPRLSFDPFDPSTKRSEARIRDGGRIVRVIKGEPSVLAELAGTGWNTISAEVAKLSSEGARVLAVASGTDSEVHPIGLIALSDPVREDASALVEELSNRGVRVLLVTGDGEATAQAVGARVGIKGDIAPAGIIGKGLDAEAIARFGIFARVLPQDKFTLVEALQKAGHVVGMTGDGVNDAPALRQADIGIATANATDVAKASASLVLTRPGLGEITMAIDGSRQIFQRLQTFISAMTTMKMANPTFYSLGVVVFGAFVVSPLLMVLFMLAADIAFVALSMDRVVPSQRPNRWALGPLMATSLGRSLVLLIFSTAVFVAGQRLLGLTIDQTQTLVFIWLVFSAQAVLYSTRLASFCWHKPYPARPLWLASTLDVVVVTLMATLGILMVPIPPSFVAGALALAVCLLILVDLLKVGVGHLTAKPIYARD